MTGNTKLESVWSSTKCEAEKHVIGEFGNTKLESVWSSTQCEAKKHVICEFAGESSFKTWQNHTLSAEPIATARNVNSSEQCRSLCEELRLARAECVAALFEPEDTLCKLFKFSTKLKPKNLTNYNGILMTREVFPYDIQIVTKEERSNYTNITGDVPHPAGHPGGCNATEPCYHDVIPDDVNMTSYDPVSTMCGNSCIRGRSFKITDSVTDFIGDATSEFCGDQKVAIAESEEELAFFIQCLCLDKDLPGFVVRLKTQKDTPFQESLSRFQGSREFSILKLDCHDCNRISAEHKIVSCRVGCHGNLTTVATKSVLCENKTDMNAPTTTCVPPTTTTAASTTTDSPTTTTAQTTDSPTTTTAQTTDSPTTTTAQTTDSPTTTTAQTTDSPTTTTAQTTDSPTTTTAPTTDFSTTTVPTTTSATTTAPTTDSSTTTTAPTTTSATTTAPTIDSSTTTTAQTTDSPTTTTAQTTDSPTTTTAQTTDSPTTTTAQTTDSPTTATQTTTSATTAAQTTISATTAAQTTTSVTTAAQTTISATTAAQTSTSVTTAAQATTSATTAAPATATITTAAPATTTTTTPAPTTTTSTTAPTNTPTTTAAQTSTSPCRKPTNTTLPCCCMCYKVRNFSKELNLTTEKLLEKRDKEIKKELTVNVSNLSKTKAKKMSQVDQRGSSQSMGSLAIVLFAVVFGMIVLSDFNKLGACPHCLRRNEKEEMRLQEEEKMKTEEQKREWGAEMGNEDEEGNEEDGENLIRIRLRMMHVSETGSDVSPEADSEV
ncbi:hypothetical protein V1264_002801 [Littorina saxatilis]|uniref:Apple domain-containing protein n=1 Tax=Littorina saxatilis TaxID=31220 RepID=A0AAN9B3N3_9CAEN